MRSSTPQALTCLLDKKAGFTYEYFHGPARSQGLAETHPGGSEDSDMSGVVKNITYGDLWSNKNAKKAHGEPAVRRVMRTQQLCPAATTLMLTCMPTLVGRPAQLADDRIRGSRPLPLNMRNSFFERSRHLETRGRWYRGGAPVQKDRRWRGVLFLSKGSACVRTRVLGGIWVGVCPRGCVGDNVFDRCMCTCIVRLCPICVCVHVLSLCACVVKPAYSFLFLL
jgi:hypothetical protein